MTPLSIPSPPIDWGGVDVGPFTIRVYALAILTGIFVAIWLARKRWVARGGEVAAIEEIAVWAIPFGIVGGRLYHVISTPGPYFGEGGHPLDAFKIWNGGLGIWGAVALGALGAYIGARRQGVSFSAFMDAAAPGVLIAQAIGRIGNYFNQELFGGPTTLPWGLEIDPMSPSFPREFPVDTTFHPTFLYELLWNLAGATLILILDRKYKFRFGRMFWLYVIVYTSGRLWIEMVRIDTAVHVLGVRINVWVSIAVLLFAVAAFLILGWRHRKDGDDPPNRPTGRKPGADASPKSKAGSAKPASRGEADSPKGRAAQRLEAGAKPRGTGRADSGKP